LRRLNRWSTSGIPAARSPSNAMGLRNVKREHLSEGILGLSSCTLRKVLSLTAGLTFGRFSDVTYSEDVRKARRQESQIVRILETKRRTSCCRLPLRPRSKPENF
jgi:hypothetical protein